MSQWNQWLTYADSLSRCLVSVMPQSGSLMFTNIKANLHSPEMLPTSGDGQWYRAFPGYFFIGPEGGNHHYQHDAPVGIAPEDIRDSVTLPGGELEHLLDELIANVQLATAGQPIEAYDQAGHSLQTDFTAEDRAAMKQLLERLIQTRDVCSPEYNLSMLGQLNSSLMGMLFTKIAESAGNPEPIVTLLRPMTTGIMELRWNYGVDSRLMALFYVQARIAETALNRFNEGKATAGQITRFVSMSLESKSVGHDPEQMLAQMVKDAVGSGLGELLLPICDEALSAAQTEVENALKSTDLPTHANHLYGAVHQAFAGMRMAEAFRECVPIANRPPKATDSMLKGYARNCEEIVVRAAQALAIDCINRGSGEAIKQHVARLRIMLQAGEEGKAAAKANEWINEYYYYPAYYAEAMLKQAAELD